MSLSIKNSENFFYYIETLIANVKSFTHIFQIFLKQSQDFPHKMSNWNQERLQTNTVIYQLRNAV